MKKTGKRQAGSDTGSNAGGQGKSANGKRLVTSYDVAAYLGVSQSAVSRVFRAGSSVSQEMRTKVLEAAEHLGYRPNAIARSLINQRSTLVALLVTEHTSLNYPDLITELAQGFASHDLRLVPFILRAEDDIDATVQEFLRYQVAGVVSAVRLSPQQVDVLAQRDIPVVFYNRRYSDLAASSICCDQAHGMGLIANRLLESGHRSFLLLSGPTDSPVSKERSAAFRQKVREAGLDAITESRGSMDMRSGWERMQQIPAAQYPDAIVCVNDAIAIGALDAARHVHGKTVPADVSVTGFDGLMPAYWASYQITTIQQPVSFMFKSTIEVMVERINKPTLPPVQTIVQGAFVPGKTARLSEFSA